MPRHGVEHILTQLVELATTIKPPALSCHRRYLQQVAESVIRIS